MIPGGENTAFSVPYWWTITEACQYAQSVADASGSCRFSFNRVTLIAQKGVTTKESLEQGYRICLNNKWYQPYIAKYLTEEDRIFSQREKTPDSDLLGERKTTRMIEL